ncbi:MAG: PAS domain S-box protein [Oscillochloris sp.]|nr:PAS domain S-box protein [Oscillochloris sp.]
MPIKRRTYRSRSRSRALHAPLSAANAQLQAEVAIRERTELALHESEARFRRMADNAPDVIYRFDYLPDRRFTYVSTAINALTGYTPEDYYTNPDLGWAQLHPDDRPLFQRMLADPDSLRGSIEMRWLHRSGAVVWVEQRNVPIFDAERRLIAVEGIVRDISERKHTSEALRESEQRYRTLVENMTQGVIVYQDGRVVFSNAATARIVGCSIDAMLHYSLVDLVGLLHPDDMARIRLGLNATPPTTPAMERPFRFYRVADGELRWVSTQSTSTTYNGRHAVLVVISDVTELKFTEERLRLSEARLHLLLDKTPAVIFSARAEGDFHTTFISESIRTLLGYTPDQFMHGNRFWASRIHPEDMPQVFGDAALLFAQGWRQYEYRCRHADGNYRWVETGVSLLPAVEGHPAEVIGYMINITERKQAEETLRYANAELAHAARMKDAFLANMSHELRTPLNAILGRAELLQEQFHGPLSDAQLRSVVSIAESGRHLLDLINDILDLSKVEAGRLDLQIEQIMIADVCQASMIFVKELALKNSLKLTLDLSAHLDEMPADPRRLKQMLINLLSNAVKFTPSGGQVCLEVRCDAAARVVRFAVQDTGIGIAPEDLPRLFQPFSQLDSTLSRKHEGSGLGLALVRRLAELHGGSVTVVSELGVGSRFTITLPIRLSRSATMIDPPAPSAVPTDMQQATSAPPTAAPPATRVLLIDDNQDNILVIDEYLRAKGYHVVVAQHGQEALDRVDLARPSVILMDIQMPNLDGLEVIRRLRAIAAYATTPIIALTALAMPGDRERCLAVGASAYLAKPVSLKQLVELIEQLVQP